MTQDQNTTGAAASDMSPAEIAAMFNSEFSDMKTHVRERIPFLPRIALTVPKTEYKKDKGVEIGDWYLTPADQLAEGEKPKYERLGQSFECVVLHSAMQLTTRDDEDNRTLIESTEFQNFSGEPIMLFDARQGPMHIAAIAPYGGNAVHTISKIRKDPRWPQKLAKDGKTQVSAIGIKFNVYVLLGDGRVCLLSNTKRGHFGTDPKTGETCDFNAVSDDSFIRARAICHELTPGLTLAHRWRIGSNEVGGGSDEPRPSFRILGIQDPKLKDIIREKAQELQTWLQARWSDRISYAWNNTSPAQREQMLTAYTEVRPMLDKMGGADMAAQMFLGKRQAPALLAEPEYLYQGMQSRNDADVQDKVRDLEREVQDDAAMPQDGRVVDGKAVEGPVNVNINYGSDVKVEDLPF